MGNIISYLMQNPTAIKLLEQRKISLLNVSKDESEAILAVLSGSHKISYCSGMLWR